MTGLVGDVMAAATTVKVNDAGDALLARLERLVEQRRTTAVRDRVLDESLQAFSRGAADVGLGAVLLVAAGGLASGQFDVGDLALFAAYLGWLSFLPRMIGRVLARRKQAEIAFDRMRVLVADRDAENTVRARELPIGGPASGRADATVVRPRRVPLEQLDVVGLGARYPSGAGVENVSFSIRRGEFVVITGAVGSGKSTLLRALLGLAWQAEVTGEVRWNGRVLDDRQSFLVPPNAAFLPQVPQLISDSLATNVAFGGVSDERLREALRLAVMDADLADMPDGIDTLIGPAGCACRGVSGSGSPGHAPWCTTPSWWCSTTSRARSTSRPSCACGRTSPRPA